MNKRAQIFSFSLSIFVVLLLSSCTKITYRVEFAVSGGSSVPSQTINSGEKATRPPDPTKANYVFEDWYESTPFVFSFDFATTTITKNITLYANWTPKVLNASMAWVSMREALVEFDNGTAGAKEIGVIVSKESFPPDYSLVDDYPSFYVRKTKADGTKRTVYLSMTDKMTPTRFSDLNGLVSIDGNAGGFFSATSAAPQLLHPNTTYYVHFYEIATFVANHIHKLEFKTTNYPTTYPSVRGTYGTFYDHISASSTDPNMEYKSTESYLIPIRAHYSLAAGSSYSLIQGTIAPTDFNETSANMRPLTTKSSTSSRLTYDLYNLNKPSGPSSSIILWDAMVKTSNLSDVVKFRNGSAEELIFYDNKKTVLVTE